jgi:hypothetical protein
MRSRPLWLEVVRHQVRRFRAPYLLVLQHHDIPSTTLLVAPVTLPFPGDVDVLAPPVAVDGAQHRIRLLDIAAVPRGMIGGTVLELAGDAGPIMGALDIILHGYPVGRPV